MANIGYKLEELFVQEVAEKMVFLGKPVADCLSYGKGLQKPDMTVLTAEGFRFDVSVKTSGGNNAGLVNNTPRKNLFEIGFRHQNLMEKVVNFVDFLDKLYIANGAGCRIAFPVADRIAHADVLRFFYFIGTAKRDSTPRANMLVKVGSGLQAVEIKNPVEELKLQVEFKKPRYKTDPAKSPEWDGHIVHVRIV